MARSWYGCALVAAFCVSTAGRPSQAQQRGAPPAVETPPTAAALEARIETALGDVTSFQFKESPLSDIVVYIQERHKIAIQLDTAALDTAGVTSDSPVTIDVEGVTLRSALNLMLKSIELTYCLQDGVLLITTQEEVDNHLATEVYDVRHFLYDEDEQGRRVRNDSNLINLVTTHVQPTTWADVGGTAAIQVIDRSLVVSQSWDVQQDVGQFLKALEKGHDQYLQGNIQATILVAPDDTSSTQAVRRALAEPTSLQFKVSPLSDIVGYIKERHRLQILLDTAALDTAGVTTDSPVTIDVEGVPLANALNIMLRSIELTDVVANEVLLFTTPEEVDSKLSTRIYPVRDLMEAEERASTRPKREPQVAPPLAVAAQRAKADVLQPVDVSALQQPESRRVGDASCGGDAARLIELVTSTIEATTWTDVGGTGAITYVPEFQGLVISQTDDVHEQIEALFERLRKVAKMQDATKEEPPATDKSGEFSLKPYYLTLATGQRAKDVGAVSSLIQRVIEPGSWQANDGRSFIHIVDDALMIQATNATHERIEALLEQLRINNGGSGQGAGGFGGGGAATDAKPESKPAASEAK